jgi:circadian clock protein KaiB
MGEHPKVKFRLFVAGESANSILAIANLNALCCEHLKDCHQIEIVDVLREPRKGLDTKVLLTPTLVIEAPLPVRRIVGNLSNPQPILEAIGLGI